MVAFDRARQEPLFEQSRENFKVFPFPLMHNTGAVIAILKAIVTVSFNVFITVDYEKSTIVP